MTDDGRPNLTTGESRVWRSGPEGLYLNGIVVSFQRYRLPAGNVVAHAPASCGILPVAREAGRFLLALPEGEAFWIGAVIQPDGGELAVAVGLAGGADFTLERYTRAGAFVIPGIPRPDGRFDAFSRASISEVRVRSAAEIARVGLADVPEFFARTGQDPPAPFDSGAAYGGWRLP